MFIAIKRLVDTKFPKFIGRLIQSDTPNGKCF